jgi:hypothetical protein
MNPKMAWIFLFTFLGGTNAAAQTTPCPPQATAGVFWPVGQSCETNAHPINGTLGELRSPRFNAGVSAPHLHDGVDIAVTPGTPVFAAEAGLAGPVQQNSPNSQNKGIRIGRFAYLHLGDVNPQILLLSQRCQSPNQQCQPVPQGMLIGHTSPAFNHLHFIEGGPLLGGTPLSNPLGQLFNYQDTLAPTIPANIQMLDQTSNLLPLAGTDFLLNSPQLNILATASDAQDPPGSSTVGLYKIGYRVQGVSTGNSFDSGEIFNTVFDKFDQNAQVNLVYDTSSSAIYGYRVTNLLTTAKAIDVTQLSPGRYEFTVIAEDIAGNRNQDSAFGVTPIGLTVTTSGTGGGTVTSSPAGITGCTGTCSATFPFGTDVTLTASPAPSSTLVGWSGDCSGTAANTTLKLTADRTCVATFATSISKPSLTVAVVGAGRVVSSPPGIDCSGSGSSCGASFPSGTVVTLSAVIPPPLKSGFDSWSGCVSADTTCILSLTSDTQVTANYVLAQISLLSATCQGGTPEATLSVTAGVGYAVIGGRRLGGGGNNVYSTFLSCGAWSSKFANPAIGPVCFRAPGQPNSTIIEMLGTPGSQGAGAEIGEPTLQFIVTPLVSTPSVCP